MVEKPKPEDAPSDLAIMGRYLLTPAIFDCIKRLKPGAGGELQLTDAMRMLLETEAFSGLVFTSGRYDTGNKLDWLRATVEIALGHPVLGADFRKVLQDINTRTFG
jgi:UTP--glucose-1-phosphate uridylyltransferase